jgi:hypothetical protein
VLGAVWAVDILSIRQSKWQASCACRTTEELGVADTSTLNTSHKVLLQLLLTYDIAKFH